MGKSKPLQKCRGILAIALIVAMCFGMVPIDSLSGLFEVSAQETETIQLSNSDFKTSVWNDENGWSITSTAGSYTAKNDDGEFNFYIEDGGTMTLTHSAVELEKGTYQLSVQAYGGSATLAFQFGDETEEESHTVPTSSYSTVTSKNFTLTEAGSVSVAVVLDIEAGGWGYLDNATLVLVSSTDNSEDSDDDSKDPTDQAEAVSLVNGDFETDIWSDGKGWTTTPDSWNNFATGSIDTTNTCRNGSNALGIWFATANTYVTFTQTVSLEAGTYQLSGYAKETNGKEATIQFTGTDGEALELSSDFSEFKGTFTLSEKTDYTVTIKVSSTESGAWVVLDDVTLTKVTAADDTETSVHTIAELNALIANVPADYQTAGFTTASTATLKAAVEAAKTCVANEDLTTVDNCYTALTSALSGLVYSDNTIYVEKVDNLSDDFIKGIDISSYISETNSGVVYRDWNGNKVDGVGFIKLFADTGVNYIRLRVWNDPYVVNEDGTPATDDDGNIKWYGGGNNNLETTKEICSIIKKYNDKYNDNIQVLIDFHYSDFWVDPEKQNAPKAWADITDINELTEKVAEFTENSLKEIASTGVTIGMVQIGNETNNGICGQEVDTAGYYAVFRAGCNAVKEYDSSILRVVHYTDPQTSGLAYNFAKKLEENKVEYDVYATSYYPYWHGTTDNLYTILNKIATDFDKKVMVAETQYVYTNEDYDGADNQAYEGKSNIDLSQWPVSVQGQANEIRDVIAAVAKVGENGIGVFYWEPAWLGVGNAYDADGNLDADKLAANRAKWNIYGSGWATDYAAEFDPSAEKYGGGGTNNENASLFDFNGNPLASLNVFKYVNYGAVTEKSFYRVEELEETTVSIGSTAAEVKAKLPTTVTFSYNDGSEGTASVTWNESSINEVVSEIASSSAVGKSYLIEGTITVGGVKHNFNVSVLAELKNYLVNGDFEGTTGWEFQDGSILFYEAKNERSGEKAITINTYSDCTKNLTPDANGCYQDSVFQTVTNLPAGIYEAKVYFEGDSDVNAGTAGKNEGEYINISATYGGNTSTSDNVVLDGWKVWQCAVVSQIVITEEMVKAGTNSVTLAANVSLQQKTWGSLDDFYLYRVGDVKTESTIDQRPIEDSKSTEGTELTEETEESELTVESNQMEGVPQVGLNVERQDLLEAGLITEEELVNGDKVKIQMKVQDVDTTVYAKEVQDINEVATDAGYLVGCYLNLTLWKSVNDGTFTEMSNLKNNIKLSVIIPEELRADNREYAIARFHEGEVAILDGKYDPATGEFTFETNGFSTYAIVYKDIEAVDNQSVLSDIDAVPDVPVAAANVTSPDTGDQAPVIPYLILLAAALGMIAFPAVRRRRVKY
jgi:arabinogalactan endo-1,4-beta-galactosidase